MSNQAGTAAFESIPQPPDTPRRPVEEVVHGETLVDVYRWLEDDSEETREWTARQNAYTDKVLAGLPVRAELGRRLSRYLDAGLVGTPSVRGDRVRAGGDLVFYSRRPTGRNQPVLCARPREAGPEAERVLVDPNDRDARGLVSLDWWQPSPDGSRVAFGLSERGDEWSILHVLDVASGTLLPERIPRARHSSVAWTPDAAGFYYTRNPSPGEVPPGEENYNRRVYFHRVDDDPSADVLVFGPGRPRIENHQVILSEDGCRLLLLAHQGHVRTDVYVRAETGDPAAPLAPVVEGVDALFRSVHAGDRLYLHTNFKAPRWRLVAVDPANPDPERWREIIPEPADGVLQGVERVGDRLLVHITRHAVSQLFIHDLDGRRLAEVSLPAPGTVTAATAAGREDAYICFESFAVPPALYQVGMERGSLEPWAASDAEAPFAGGELEMTQVFFTSRDGTRVPMFILQRTGAADGPRPTLLTGYGGFNISRTPLYSPAVFPWLEAGGVYALANLRGGSEYGEDWHRAGMHDKKQNVFDDFIAAAEYLIAEGYTDRGHLGISGRSNGGLLVGAALTQRPDLFQAVVCGVPLLDMIRYHQFLIARLWIPEYGSSEDPAAFRWLLDYSPYHNVREDVAYPAVYLSTATSDTRVHPMHARKMAPLLQRAAAAASGGPVLLRVEDDAGHGAGKPIAKLVEEQVEVWTFLAWQLGLDLTA